MKLFPPGNNRRFPFAIFIAMVIWSSPIAAQLPQPAESDNRFTFGARLGFNISAKFENSGGFPAQSDPGPASGHTVNRNYDDGYVRVDNSGNAANLTWNWGYRDATQVPGNGTLLQHSSSAGSAPSSRADADSPQLGTEAAWWRTLGQNQKLTYGFVLAFNYTDFTISDSSTLRGTAQRLTDTFSLGGIIPPGAPAQPGWQYRGAFAIPGPVIDDQPVSRSFEQLPGGAVTTGSRRLAGDLLGWKVGGWLEVPLTGRLSLVGSGGLAFGYLDTTFSFQEATTIAGMGTLTAQGSGSTGGWVWGGYVEGLLNYQLSSRWSAFAGIEYQYLTDYTQQVQGHTAQLDLGQAWYLHAGVGLSF